MSDRPSVEERITELVEAGKRAVLDAGLHAANVGFLDDDVLAQLVSEQVLAAALAYEFTDPCPNITCYRGCGCLNADCTDGRVPSRVRLILGEQIVSTEQFSVTEHAAHAAAVGVPVYVAIEGTP